MTIISPAYDADGALRLPSPPAGTRQSFLLASEWTVDRYGIPVPFGAVHLICGEPSAGEPAPPDARIAIARHWTPLAYITVAGTDAGEGQA
jgi:hypothetical protein